MAAIIDAGDSLEALIGEGLRVLNRDWEDGLSVADAYLRGDFDDPYSPKGMLPEHKAMMRRARQNWCEIPVNAAVQALAVDGFRSGDQRAGDERSSETPEWDLWQRSNLDAKQAQVHRSAVAYGQAFTVVERGQDGRAYVRVLSALRTVCLFEDALSDDNAILALSVMRRPGFGPDGRPKPGLAVAWDRYNRYDVVLPNGGEELVVGPGVAHGGAGHCPVTRFVSQMDDEGRVQGAVLPLKQWQDSFNQMLFNLLLEQSHGAHRVLWATGLEPAVAVDADGMPVVGPDGGVVRQPIAAGPGDFLVNSSPDGKFGSLPVGDQSGYIAAMDALIKDFSAISQTPPNFLLGQMANLSADALNAAEKSFRRKVELYRTQFGESWERTLRVGMVLEGRAERDQWEHNEVLWRDLESAALSQTADALSKLREIGVPSRGLWEMVPGVSPVQLDRWDELAVSERLGSDFGAAVQGFSAMGAQNTLDGPVAASDAGPVSLAGGDV